MNAELTAAELWERMPERWRDVCKRAARAADRLGQTAYLVGGCVRDLFLGATQADIDIVVEGDAPALARELGRELGETVRRPSQFMTATVDLPDGGRLDIATARQETYPEPAKLPIVEPAAIAEDLRRRDFSVNAIALRLTASGAGEPVDPCGGRQDLDGRIIRVLHDCSFIDDPTRIVRAARFGERLGFALEHRTVSLIEEAARGKLLERVSGARMREEVVKLLDEPSPAAVLERLKALGALQQVFPGLLPSRQAYAWLAEARTALAALRGSEARGHGRDWPYLLGALWARDDAEEIARRLELDGEAHAIVRKMGEAARSARPESVARRSRLPDEALDHALEGTGTARLVLYWLRAAPEGRRRLERYSRELAPASANIDGHDLQEQGVSPGPAIGVGLRAARRARLAGHRSPEDQIGAALAAVREWRHPARRRRRRRREPTGTKACHHSGT